MNIRDDDTDTGAIQSSGTRDWITLMSTGTGHGTGSVNQIRG